MGTERRERGKSGYIKDKGGAAGEGTVPYCFQSRRKGETFQCRTAVKGIGGYRFEPILYEAYALQLRTAGKSTFSDGLYIA